MRRHIGSDIIRRILVSATPASYSHVEESCSQEDIWSRNSIQHVHIDGGIDSEASAI